MATYQEVAGGAAAVGGVICQPNDFEISLLTDDISRLADINSNTSLVDGHLTR